MYHPIFAHFEDAGDIVGTDLACWDSDCDTELDMGECAISEAMADLQGSNLAHSRHTSQGMPAKLRDWHRIFS